MIWHSGDGQKRVVQGRLKGMLMQYGKGQRQHVMAQAKELEHRRKALTGVGALHSLKHQITAPSIQLVHLYEGAFLRRTQRVW